MTPEVPATPPVLPIDPVRESPWGFWATIAWTIVIMGAAVAGQTAALVSTMLVLAARGTKVDPQDIAADGDYLAIATCTSGIVAIGLSLCFAAIRKGISVKEYLAMRPPTLREFGKFFVFLLIFVLVSDGLTALLGKQVVPDFMIDTYESTSWALPLLLLALFVTAPLSEEFLFRGFMFEGLRRSRLGLIGAIIVTAAVWAGIHLQYDFHGILVIFFLGLFLGYVRHKTGSVWLCVLLHAIMNLIATIELLVVLNGSNLVAVQSFLKQQFFALVPLVQ